MSGAQPPPSTPKPVAAVAQSRGGEPPLPQRPARQPGEGRLYRIGARVDRAALTRPHVRAAGEPLYRPLQVYALHPAVSRLDGGVMTLNVPYEPLAPGPVGAVVEIDGRAADGRRYASADLDRPFVALNGGHAPSLSSPQFHQQMVYAVAMLTYNTFGVALGRSVAWSFAPRDGQANRLRLRPFGARARNAWYDPDDGEIVFGYDEVVKPTAAIPPGGFLFTSVSHDVIAHEMTHALLDGLRARLLVPTHPDVAAFHEALADLVAFLQHFTFSDVVRAEFVRSRGRLDEADLLVDIAQEFGRAYTRRQALRTLRALALDADGGGYDNAGGPGRVCAGRPARYDCRRDGAPHDLAEVLTGAVFDAFLNLYRRRTRRYVKLATGGSGVLPDGDLPAGLLDFLVAEVRSLANQFLSICIRAVDYCPPVDVRFGDYLRALISADLDLVPDDDWGYRETLIGAFGARGIYGEGTASMSEDALQWRPPRCPLPALPQLRLAAMPLSGVPARPQPAEALREQAGALGRLATDPAFAREFGLVSPRDRRFGRDGYTPPVIESIRLARRVGPDRQLAFDSVAEIIQVRHSVDDDGREMRFYGGSTVIVGPDGAVRYIVRKRVDNDERLQRQRGYLRDPDGRRLAAAGRAGIVRALHRGAPGDAGAV